MRKVVHHWKSHTKDLNQYTIEQWAGDMVLGKALKDAQVSLLWAFPHFQGDPVSTLDHNITKINRQPWCYPAITYHHMAENEIRSLCEFEQEWYRRRPRSAPLRHADVFKGHIYPSLSRERSEWHSYSINTAFSNKVLKGEEMHSSFEACKSACERNTRCLQFSHRTSKCLVSSEVRLGRAFILQCSGYSTAASRCEKMEEPAAMTGGAVRSGWIVDRLEKYMSTMDQTCDNRIG